MRGYFKAWRELVQKPTQLDFTAEEEAGRGGLSPQIDFEGEVA